MHASSPSSVTPTDAIVESLTRAIVEHRLQPGSKLAEQRLADQFGVSRTLVRQALFQLSQQRLVTLEPARGAFVAAPSMEEARQVFGVRRMLEAGLVKAFMAQQTESQLRALEDHIAQEKMAIARGDVAGRTTLLGDFHVHMAELMGNTVLAQMLGELISRCALITLMYQSSTAASHSVDEHATLVDAMRAGDELRAVRCMDEHLRNVAATLNILEEETV
ncbi:GntR family transcriptional regulator [Curvibacter sp. APW13]|uniref:GntR family transcriptional regulator n=1 Tax=Curvibacter sp. APW13 TaxID=3077236 RepID=UPI0028E098B2|nr:GntR family transcriptional regulator [Curvibacter sp. APW13]MDT8992419.1 GntR family transcriptional regulator [Curvibacter sp. APW13]